MKDYKILVIEDDPSVLNLLVNILESEEYIVVAAHDGKEALEKLDYFLPDVILSDVMMPHVNGFELIRLLQKNEQTKHIPFLFLSAKKDIKDRVEGLSIGADDYICKPFSMDELLMRIKTRLQKKEKLLASQKMSQGAMVGDLTFFPVLDLIQVLRFEKKTGKITLTFKKNTASIKMNNGDVVDIEMGDLSGIQAFRAILEQNQGWFSFSLATENYPVKMSLSTQELLVESTKQIDEFKNLLSKLPPLDTMFRICDRQSDVVLSVKQMKVLYLFDGNLDLGEVLKLSSFEQSTTIDIIEELIENGFIETKEDDKGNNKCENSYVLNSLDKTSHNMLAALIADRSGIPCLMVIGLEDTPVEGFIHRLCGPQNHDIVDYTFNKKENIEFKKFLFNCNNELNIYGLRGFRQFSFLWHVLQRDIVGLIFLISKIDSLLASQTKGFFKLLEDEYKLPYIISLLTESEDIDYEADTQLNIPIIPCSIESIQSMKYLFDQWLKAVMNFKMSD